jgi:DNA-binding transcriptional LysR family regulator
VDRLDAMALFVAVADARGFASAAKRLGVSPSVATRVIAALEERLGARLLQRTTRSVTLTDAGTRFLERARRILGDVAEAEGAAQAERSIPTGRFIVTAPSVFGRMHVAPVVSDFLAKYREVRGELLLGDRMANLVDEGIDAAVRIGVLEDSSYVARAVGATRRVLVGSPEYLAASKKLRSPDDLSRHRVIQLTSLVPDREWTFFHKDREVRIAVPVHYVTNSADAAIVQAERGGGLSMVLSYQVADAVRAGRLAVVLAAFEPPPRPIQIVFPTTRLLSAKVRAFVELVTTSCDWTFTRL